MNWRNCANWRCRRLPLEDTEVRALLGWALLASAIGVGIATTDASSASRYRISASAIEHDPAALDGDRFRLKSRLMVDTARPTAPGAGLQAQGKLVAVGGCVVTDAIFASGFETAP